jgi:serine O-acetyltransferase
MDSLLGTMRKDILRYIPASRREQGLSTLDLLVTAVKDNSIWLVLIYRVGHWIRTSVPSPLLRFLLMIPYTIVCRPMNFLHNTHISLEAEIGEGLYLGHYGGVWIGRTRMGCHCNIHHGVTIGIGGRGEGWGTPVIGDRVWVGPGSILFGNITIGNDVAIGANAVVSKSLPDMAVAAGNPARIVGYEGSADQIEVWRART